MNKITLKGILATKILSSDSEERSFLDEMLIEQVQETKPSRIDRTKRRTDKKKYKNNRDRDD